MQNSKWRFQYGGRFSKIRSNLFETCHLGGFSGSLIINILDF